MSHIALVKRRTLLSISFLPALFLGLALAAPTAHAGDRPVAKRHAQPADQPIDRSAVITPDVPIDIPAKFITSLVTDTSGNLWAGAEDDGVWRITPAGEKTQFTTSDGLSDNNGYALAVDTLGRVWVGHLNHGVSVFNGEKWQNYEVVGGLSRNDSLSGPLGERVFDIAVNRVNGDVWIATNLGLSRYTIDDHRWSYFTRVDGLPSDQIACVAVDGDGTLYVGTQCDGVAIGKGPDYKTWKTIPGPDRPGMTPSGSGLPSALTNDLLVMRDGSVWLATNFGLAVSRNKGTSWSYVRGADYVDKVKGRFGGQPKGWSPKIGPTLLEDYVT